MKKVFFILNMMLMLTVCLSVSVAEAEDTTVELKELNLTMDIPQNLTVFTRDVTEDNPNLDMVGLTADEFKKMAKKANLYLNAISTEPLYEVVVTMVENKNGIFNFADYSPEDLTAFGQGVSDNNLKQNQSFNQYTFNSVYTAQQGVFVVFDIEQQMNDMKVYGKQYYTVYNGQVISIVLQSYKNPITPNLAEMEQQMINSIKFTTTLSSQAEIIPMAEVLAKVEKNGQKSIFANKGVSIVLLLGVIVIFSAIFTVFVRKRNGYK